MLKRSFRSRDLAVERLSLALLAAIAGANGLTACSGRSERHEVPSGEAGDAGDAGSSGRGGAGGKGGAPNKGSGGSNIAGTSGATTGAGGSSNSGGSSASGGSTTAGTGASAGDGGSDAGASGSGDSGGTGGFPGIDCGAPTPWGELERCDGPFVHRPTVTTCGLPERLGPGEGGAGGTPGAGGSGAAGPIPPQCETDLDCEAEPNGYCAIESNDQTGPYNACIYACGSDSDCASTEICACSDTFLRSADEVTIALGVCRPATCAEDAECGGGQLCISPIYNGCGQARPGAFHCQSLEDECAGKSDCAGNEYCTYNGTAFVCQQEAICGRPFIVEGTARLAELASAGDWAECSLATSNTELSDELRAEIARHYVQAGLMEHASIAAFARFSLQLLALGAPAELVEASTRAMQDETRHAKLCFGLAARYGKHAGPGALELHGALEDADLLRVTDLVITEGCIGETGAALEVAWAADAAEDAELARLLHGIAEDELRHAALAFRFVAWAAGRDARVVELLHRRLGEARAACRATQRPASSTERASQLARHGVLDEATRAEARRRALEEIVTGAVATASATPGRAHLTSSMSAVAQPNSSST